MEKNNIPPHFVMLNSYEYQGLIDYIQSLLQQIKTYETNINNNFLSDMNKNIEIDVLNSEIERLKNEIQKLKNPDE
jgi:polyhydroxyalkanoate synthesis regulator phasin